MANKLAKFKEYLSLDESIDYLSFLINEPVDNDDFFFLIARYLTVYTTLYFRVAPITINKSKLEEIDYDNPLEPFSLYMPVSNIFKDINIITDSNNNCYIYIEGDKNSLLKMDITFFYNNRERFFFHVNEIINASNLCNDIYSHLPKQQKLKIPFEVIDFGATAPKTLYLEPHNEDDNRDKKQLFSTRERNNACKIMAALLIANKIQDLTNYKIAEILETIADKNKFDNYPSKETVVKSIKIAKEYLPNNDPN